MTDTRPGGLEVSGATEIVLVRHGAVERGLTGPDGKDPWLSELGRAQARSLADVMVEEKFDAIYSSPLRRAAQTAAPLAGDRDLEVLLRDGFAEFDKNADEYLFFEDLKKANDPRYAACLSGDLTAWGTDFPTFRAEALAAFDEVVETHAGGKVLVVSHGGTLNALLGHVLGLDRMWFFFPNHTGVSRVAVNHKGRMRIVTLNERHHLPGVEAVL